MADTKLYKEEVTKHGAMKIEVVLEEAKKKKRPASARTRPGSATSVRSMGDIEKIQQVTYQFSKMVLYKIILQVSLILGSPETGISGPKLGPASSHFFLSFKLRKA